MKTVTYNDLEKAAPDIEMHGVAFHDGDAVEVDDSVADALKGNRFFSFGDEAVPDDDLTLDKFHTMGISDLRSEADQRGIRYDGMSKADLRDAIRAHDKT